MIGLSVSFCVRDIVEGKVKLNEVKLIVAGTNARTSEDWKRIIASYRDCYWSKNPDACVSVLRELIHSDRIFQPRVFNGNGDSPFVGDGHWLLNGAKVRDIAGLTREVKL